MLNDPDRAFFEFKKLKLHWKSLSESDTRSKMIDKIFTCCLGWSESDITREEPIDGGYVDYIFHVDGLPKFAVEAKRKGVSFELPLSLKSHKYKLSGAISKNEREDLCLQELRLRFAQERCAGDNPTLPLAILVTTESEI